MAGRAVPPAVCRTNACITTDGASICTVRDGGVFSSASPKFAGLKSGLSKKVFAWVLRFHFVSFMTHRLVWLEISTGVKDNGKRYRRKCDASVKRW